MSRRAPVRAPSRLPGSPITDRLFGRLDAGDVAEIEATLDPSQRDFLAEVPLADRRRLLLAWGVHHRVPAVLEKTRLSAAEPPPEVHTMARGSAAAGGSAYYADMVVDALSSAGMELANGMRALDFGCSSGRVVRVLEAAHPNVSWQGCDPIGSSIEWARAHLPRIEFHQSSGRPPLRYADGCFDFVFAISIWSHFSDGAALSWLDEMRRAIRPGGLLVLTTHGRHSVQHDSERGLRTPEQLAEIEHALEADGYWFTQQFSETGDHGLYDPDWGTAFWTAERLRLLAGGWKVSLFAPGSVENNQDLFVLEAAGEAQEAGS